MSAQEGNSPSANDRSGLPQQPDTVVAHEMDSTSVKLLRWLIFNVIVALLPLGFAALLLVAKPWDPARKGSISTIVLGTGELLLISTAIAAEAIGDLIASDKSNKSYKY